MQSMSPDSISEFSPQSNSVVITRGRSRQVSIMKNYWRNTGVGENGSTRVHVTIDISSQSFQSTQGTKAATNLLPNTFHVNHTGVNILELIKKEQTK